MANDSGSGDYKVKLYLAVKELVGPGTITDRLRCATMGIAFLLERDFPSAISERVMALQDKLTGDYGLLKDNPSVIPDDAGAKLAEEFIAVFAIACDREFVDFL